MSDQHDGSDGAPSKVKVETYLCLETGATSFIARVHATAIHAHGATVHLAFDPDHLHLFDAQKETALG